MQHGWRETRKAFQAAAYIEIADERRGARGAQFGAARGLSRQGKNVRARSQKFDAAHADIAATDDQHARPAQDSCRFHGGRIVAVKRGLHSRLALITDSSFSIDLWHLT
jgi:hypothetical protein